MRQRASQPRHVPPEEIFHFDGIVEGGDSGRRFSFGVRREMELKCAGQPRVEGRDGPRNQARMAQAAERSKREYAYCAARISKCREASASETLFRCCSRLSILDQSRQAMGIAIRRQKDA